MFLITCYGSCNWPSQAQRSMSSLLQGFQEPGPQTAGPAGAKGELQRRERQTASAACYGCTKSLWTTAHSRVYRQLGVQHGSTFSPSTSLTLSLRRTRLSVSAHLSPCLIKGAPFAPFVMLPQLCQRVILCPIYSKNPMVYLLLRVLFAPVYREKYILKLYMFKF